MKVQVALLLVVAAALGEALYEGAQVLTIDANTVSKLKFLNWLLENSELDFWTEPRSLGMVDVMAEGKDLLNLKESLRVRRIDYDIKVANVAELVDEAYRSHQLAKTKSTKMDWVSYHTYDEIMGWMEGLTKSHPKIASISDVGSTFEGRTMKLLKLSTGGEGKEAIFVDGGIHAREWISPAVVTYMINEIVSGNDEGILDKVDLYFMPSINPDGYAYTHEGERLWRKTRSDTSVSFCKGADPNRNWGFHWMEGGASSNPCAGTYAGPEAFSEVEMRNVRDVLAELRPRVYLTFHSYSQMWMYPWGWTYDLPENWENLDSLAQSAVAALTAVNGKQFAIGSSATTIYIAAGGSDDWAMGAGGSEYAYTIELRDKGRYGFLLPEDQIIPSGIETFEAFKVVGKFVIDNPKKE